MKQANIKVAVRIRSLLEEEYAQGHVSSKMKLDQEGRTVNVEVDRNQTNKVSQFDYVIDQNSSQRQVFDRIGVGEMVKAVVEGYHGTIFAYG
mmetsp:Transcript_34173/g.33358  ORF Transcript_34173/g.33358 Transcript_34173/m.33358 type:complete len:92 (+) Transcript_34173:2-277(+)